MQASREILWNVSSFSSLLIMYTLFAVAIVVALNGIWYRVISIKNVSKASLKSVDLGVYFNSFIKNVILQHRVNREITPALFHTLIYVGFLVLLFTTTMVFIDHDLGIAIYQGNFYLLVTTASDVFGLGFLVGILIAAYRRYILRPDFLHNASIDSFFLVMLGALAIQGFMLEGLRIHVTKDPWALYSPVGYLVSLFFWSFSPQAARVLHFGIWWIHTINVFVLLALLPYTKLWHLLASSTNLILRIHQRAKGALEPLGDIANILETQNDVNFGLGSIKDYSFEKLLDLEACTSCGRCQAECPAYLSGKPLSPKWVILDTRNHSYALQVKQRSSSTNSANILPNLDSFLLKTFLLKQSGVVSNTSNEFKYNNVQRGQNQAVQNSVFKLGETPDAQLAGQVMDPEVFWSCTTCYACVEVCPVGINHVDHIIGVRRNQALMHGKIPHEAQNTLRSLETRGNPFGAPENRIKWAEGLSINILKPGDEVDYLYWVGCVSAYDVRKQKIARSIIKIMESAKLSYGILGNLEGCTGDPARRLGEENLFQSLAKSNIDILKSIKFKTLVANCPHCFNTLKNEYPEFGGISTDYVPEIIHHSVLLKKLIKENKLKLQGATDEYTFHDPCYLGRYNQEYEAPREALVAIGGVRIKEMEKSREKAMCCGAGGGHFWMDLKNGERINSIRLEQAVATGASKVATACPFCMQMLEDATKLASCEERYKVEDIAEIIADSL